MKSINPATNKIIHEYPTENLAAVTDKLANLQSCFASWKHTALEQRINCIRKLQNLLQDNESEYAHLITSEMGKINKEAIKEVQKCAFLCDFYIKNAAVFLAPETIQTEHSKSYVYFAPLGIILGIMPWNFPFWQVFRFAVPALLAGNVVMLKHADNVPGCALLLEKIFNDAAASFKLQPFRSALIDEDTTDKIISDPLIRGVSLTGSVNAGKCVASIAGKNLKKTVLELGGSDPYIVLADADVKRAALACTTGRLINCGQSCISAKRFIVVEQVYDEFLAEITSNFRKIKIGNPLDATTDIGPLASIEIRETLQRQVDASIKAGATCHFGGKAINNDGCYFEPTILTNIPENCPAYDQELFGPVATVFKVANEADAVALANKSVFGLGAAIFSRNTDRARQTAENLLDSGSIFINTFVASDPRLPFGGVKESGYGRELSRFGIHEFVNIKTIAIA